MSDKKYIIRNISNNQIDFDNLFDERNIYNMTKEEFLDGLRRALFSTGSEGLIEYNLDYYSSYIDGEIAKGRSMDDVMNELGDPRLIANSIKMAEGYSDVFVGLENEVID